MDALFEVVSGLRPGCCFGPRFWLPVKTLFSLRLREKVAFRVVLKVPVSVLRLVSFWDSKVFGVDAERAFGLGVDCAPCLISV